MNSRRQNEYTTLKIPKKLAEMIDEFLDKNQTYTSRTDVVKDALRRYFED